MGLSRTSQTALPLEQTKKRFDGSSGCRLRLTAAAALHALYDVTTARKKARAELVVANPLTSAEPFSSTSGFVTNCH